MRNSMLLTILVVAVAACGGKKSDDKATGGTAAGGTASGGKAGGTAELASCNTPSYKECAEYNADNRAMGDDNIKSICDAAQGTFAITPCPTADRLGACQQREGKKVFYKDYPITVDELKKDCGDRGGTWQP